ncbi:MAG: peptide ABC transporter substrate-binding protein [Euzebya sp.]
MRARRLCVGVAAVLALIGASCEATTPPPESLISSTPPPSATPVQGAGTFRYGIGEPTAIVPPLARSSDDRAVVDALFDSLTAWDVAGRAVPAAAESWFPNADLTTWTFTLRPQATFHDGDPVTADGFRQSWAGLVNDGSVGYLLEDVVGYAAASRGDTTSLAGVRALDDHTLQVSLVRPRADFPVVVGHPALGPIQTAQREADPQGWMEMPAGNGPFVMTEPWVHGDFIRAARWDGWVNGEWSVSGIAEVLFRIGDLDINYLGFTQGRRDFTAVPTDALPLAAAAFPRQGGTYNGPGLITGRRPEVYVLEINPSVPPYDDLRVRQAVSLIIDRMSLAADNEGGNLAPATGLLPPSLPGSRQDDCELCTFNASGASSRLEDAGVRQLTLDFNAAGGHERIRNLLRQALSDIGVALVSNNRGPAPTLAEYQEELVAGRVGLFRVPLVADVPSALSVLYPMLHGREVPQNGGLNYMRYNDPTVNSLLDQAARTLDEVQRGALLRRVEDLALNRDQVVVPLFTYQHAVVASERVSGLRYGPFGLLNLTEISLLS